jgi:hypothetical protein
LSLLAADLLVVFWHQVLLLQLLFGLIAGVSQQPPLGPVQQRT